MPRTAKRHDTLDPITGTATKNGEPVDLTVFATVTLFAAHADTPANNFSGPVTDANADGTWSYEQDDADVSNLGEFEIELEGVMASGKKVHFPSNEANNPKLTITADVDDA